MSTGLEPREPAAAAPPRRRPGRPPTLDRDAALRAARSVVGLRGVDRTRYSDVAEASGIPVTTLQHAFGSLQAMLLESVQRSTAGEIAVLRDRSPAGQDVSAWERLSDFVSGAVLSPEDPSSWLVWLELWRIVGRDAAIAAQAGIVYEQWWAYLEELIEAGVESGEFSGPLVESPRDAAIATVGVIDGIAVSLVLRADGPDHESTLRIALAAIAAMLGHRA